MFAPTAQLLDNAGGVARRVQQNTDMSHRPHAAILPPSNRDPDRTHVGRAGIYRFFGHAPVIATAWKLVRWPLLLAVIAAVYRYPAPTRGIPGGSACLERRWRCCCGWPRPRCSAPTCW